MLETRVLQTIQTHNLLESGMHVLIALSGGPDSVALTRLLLQLAPGLNLTLIAAHLNHQLRGEDANRDMEFVRDLCASWKIPLTLDSQDVERMARECKVSIETAGRQLRYAFLMEVAGRLGADRIATAHTADDQAETIVMNWLRGTGVRGLAGMPYQRDTIIRPLLDIEKRDILAYLKSLDQPYCVDESNQNTGHLRNKIRHHLLPLLEQAYRPGLSRRLRQNATFFHWLQEDLAQRVEAAAAKTCQQTKQAKIKLDLSTFFDYSAIIQIELIRWCVERLSVPLENWSQQHYFDCLDIASHGPTGRQRHFPDSVIVYRSYDHLVLTRESLKSTSFCYELAVPGRVDIPEIGKAVVTQVTTGAYDNLGRVDHDHECVLDAAAVVTPLTVRSWQAGDRIQIPKVGTKKVQDVFVDQKVERLERARIPLIFSGDDLLWIAGIRRSDKAQITAQTRDIITLSLETI